MICRTTSSYDENRTTISYDFCLSSDISFGGYPEICFGGYKTLRGQHGSLQKVSIQCNFTITVV